MELYEKKIKKLSKKSFSSDNDSLDIKSKESKKSSLKSQTKNCQDFKKTCIINLRMPFANKSNDTTLFMFLKEQQMERERRLIKNKKFI